MSAETTPRVFVPGTVLRYECRAGEDRQYDRNWCREGMAIADADGRLLDTYWGSGTDNHVLTEAEQATAEVVFNVNDYDELDRYGHGSRSTWETYAENDREVITSQHRLQCRWFVRKGSGPDLNTLIRNAEARLSKAREELQSAARDVEWLVRDLVRLEAQR